MDDDKELTEIDTPVFGNWITTESVTYDGRLAPKSKFKERDITFHASKIVKLVNGMGHRYIITDGTEFHKIERITCSLTKKPDIFDYASVEVVEQR